MPSQLYSVAVRVAPASAEPLLNQQPSAAPQAAPPPQLIYVPKFIHQPFDPSVPLQQLRLEFQPAITCHRRFSLAFFSALSIASVAFSIFNFVRSTKPDDQLEKYVTELGVATFIVLKEIIDIQWFHPIVSRPNFPVKIAESIILKLPNVPLGMLGLVYGIKDGNYPLAISGSIYLSSYVVTYNCTIKACAKIMSCAQGLCAVRSVAEGT